MAGPPAFKPKKAKKVTGPKRLTTFLTDMGSDVLILDDGTTATRDEMLAGQLWKMALGYTEEDGEGGQRIIKPDRSVAIFIFERREGRIPATARLDEYSSISAEDRVDELARARINAEADALAGKSNEEML